MENVTNSTTTTPMTVMMNERQVEKATAGAISIRLLQQLRQRGGGPPFVKIGRMVRYEWKDVRAWLDDRKRTSTSDVGRKAAV